jgi:hypothetical protein
MLWGRRNPHVYPAIECNGAKGKTMVREESGDKSSLWSDEKKKRVAASRPKALLVATP